MSEKNRLNAMLFNNETTYKTDFRGGAIKNLVFTTYKPKPTCLWTRPPPLKDVHTLSKWKEGGVPFSLLHKPKEIIRTNPYTVQKRYEKFEDTGLEEAIRTRPRLVMTPAVSMDNIEDPRDRGLLLDSMYTSAATRAQMEVEKPYASVKAPLPDIPAPANPVRLGKLKPPMVPPEWRMESVAWDSKQLRAYCNPTREFWLRREPPTCMKCDETKAVDALRRQQQQIMKRK